jgi:hypothetical protein
MKYMCDRERWMEETNYSVAFWMLLPVYRGVKINSDEKHTIFAHELTKGIEAEGGIFEHFFLIKPTIYTNFTNLFWHETLHVSDIKSIELSS